MSSGSNCKRALLGTKNSTPFRAARGYTAAIRKNSSNPSPGHVPSLTVKLGQRSGDLAAGAATYNWRVVTPNAPAVPVLVAQTTAPSHTFSGLTPGLVYPVTASAVNSRDADGDLIRSREFNGPGKVAR